MSRRARRGVAGSVLVVLALVIGAIVITALQAEGRERSEANTNDGGAWLLKRDVGYVGHVNRAVGEVTAAVSTAEPGSDYDVDQAKGVIVVHDRTAGVLSLVDDRTVYVTNEMQVDPEVTVHAVDGGALVVDRGTMAVWKLDRNELASLKSLDEVEPALRGEGAALSAATSDGHAVIVDHGADRVIFLRPDGSKETSPRLDLTDDAISLTFLGEDNAILADPDGDVFVATPDRVTPLETGVTDAGGRPAPLVLQQPGAAADHVVAATTDGRLFAIPVATGEDETGERFESTELGQLTGGAPVAPIVFGGCLFAVSTAPASFSQWCGDEQVETTPLEGAGSELRLRLVNGWVWVNDVDTGAAWVTSPRRRLDRVEDWGAILSDADDDADDNSSEDKGGEVIEEINPDDPNADIVESDEIDEDGPNRPPVAHDDHTQTRVDRPIDVDVLANDTDPNGDVLLVSEINQRGGNALVAINPDGRGVQVSPKAGYAGVVRFGYTITDGRGESASAVVTVEVTASNGNDNRPPEAHADIASTRKGRATTFDVLANDVDPDGDALVLESIELSDPATTAGTIVSDPSGRVVFTPDVNSTSDRIELTYVVSDDFAATAEGKVVVSVRLRDANNEPDARNDAGVTVVGKPVRIDVLHNDTDPDNDPLFIAQLPTLVRPQNRTADSLDLSLTPDGEFYFNPTTAGTYAFNYSATDGEESDVAQIHVEVAERTANRPPTAVRDDVVIPAGGTRLVYVLANDGDPDGDIVALVGHTTDHGLTVKELDGVGYLITVASNAPKRPSFRYQISDGTSDPVTAVVVVAVTDSEVIDQPPVARTDVVEVRAGGRVAVPVLTNDYDPEGGALEVASVTTNPAAETSPGLNGQTVDIDVRPDVVSSFTLSYTVADEGGNQASAFVEVRIVPADEVNRPPVARTDLARTRSGVPIAIEVAANDSDPDGDIIAVQNVRTQPGGGTARIDNGAIVYTPGDRFSGTDRFSYALVDANGEIAIGEVLVGVMPLAAQNRAPEAFDDSIEVVAGSAPLVLDVLDNDSDPDGDRILVTRVGRPSSGATAVVDGGGAVELTPPARPPAGGARGELAFTYAIDDGRGGRASATVEVVVIPSTDAVAPIAVDDQIGPVGPGQTIQVDLLRNDLDPDGNPAQLTVSSSDPTLRALDGGALTFTAGRRSSRHRYTVTDPAGLSDTAELAVLVVDNRAPSVEPLQVETAANETITIDLSGQASDPDGDTLYFVCCDGGRGGSARTLVNGPNELRVRFNPDDQFAGRATFSYTADDQLGHTVAGSVTVKVLPPTNRPPTATDADIEVQAGEATNIDLSALVRDPDPDDTLQFTTTPASTGVVQLRADGATVRATAAIDQAGRNDSFGYTVTDSAGESASATVNLTVTAPAAPPPQARPDTVTTNQATPVTVAVLANDIDPLGQGLTVTSVGASNGGTTTTDGRRVTFNPSSDFFGTTTLQYRIHDGANIPEREAEAQVTVNVIGRPSTPGSPTAVAGNATATVSWAAPAANGAPIDDYEIRIGEGGGQSIGNTTGYTWTGLTNGEDVQFSVRAHNVAGWGPWSGPSPVVTPDIEPGRPAAPTVQFADSTLVVSWNPPANEGSPISNYDLQIGGGASAVQRVGSGTSWTWPGLDNGTEYTFLVRAVNGKGEGQWSAPSAPEHPLRAPSKPPAPVGQHGDRTILVAWTPPDNGGDSIIEYEVQIQSTGATNLTTATSLQWSNLPNGEAQSFTVRARNRGGWSPPSGASVPVIPCRYPDQVPLVQAVRADQSAAVSWTAPNPQGCAITGYTIANSLGQTMSVPGNVTATTFAGLTNGTPYTFTVIATNEEGDSPASAPSNAVTPAGPPFPTTITRTVPDVGRVYVEWVAADPNGSPIVYYELSVNGGPWENVGNVLSTTRGALANGTDYSFQVRAVNDVAPGAAANTVGARTPGEPDQVGGLSLNPGDATISASWSAPPDNGKPITYYHLDIDPGGDPTSPDRSYFFGGLTNNQQYAIRVQACNDVGCGAWSGFAYAEPDRPVNINWSVGASAPGVDPRCTSQYCHWIDVSGTGLTPGNTYSIQCYSSIAGSFGSPNNATAHGNNGDLSAGNVCIFGYPGETVWVRLEPGGHESEHRTYNP